MCYVKVENFTFEMYLPIWKKSSSAPSLQSSIITALSERIDCAETARPVTRRLESEVDMSGTILN